MSKLLKQSKTIATHPPDSLPVAGGSGTTLSIITSNKLQEGGHRMSEQNKTLFKMYVDEVYHKRNVALIDEFLGPNLVEHKEAIYAFLGAFPDLHITVEDLIAEGDKIVGRVTLTGTHQGDLMGIPATGKKVSISGSTHRSHLQRQSCRAIGGRRHHDYDATAGSYSSLAAGIRAIWEPSSAGDGD